MTPDERKKVEALEKRVEQLILQQVEMLAGLEKVTQMFKVSEDYKFPLCSRCKEPMIRIVGDEYHTEELWECMTCDESQIGS